MTAYKIRTDAIRTPQHVYEWLCLLEAEGLSWHMDDHPVDCLPCDKRTAMLLGSQQEDALRVCEAAALDIHELALCAAQLGSLTRMPVQHFEQRHGIDRDSMALDPNTSDVLEVGTSGYWIEVCHDGQFMLVLGNECWSDREACALLEKLREYDTAEWGE